MTDTAETKPPLLARICPECGVAFELKRPTSPQLFCTPAHKVRFYNLQIKRGLQLTPLMQTWRTAQPRYKSGASRELAAHAYGEACRLLDQYGKDDRAAGRDPSLVIAEKHLQGWRAGD